MRGLREIRPPRLREGAGSLRHHSETPATREKRKCGEMPGQSRLSEARGEPVTCSTKRNIEVQRVCSFRISFPFLYDEALAWMCLLKNRAGAEKTRGEWFLPGEMMRHFISGTNARVIFPSSFFGG